MLKLYTTASLIVIALISLGQSDTLIKKQQNGFLFLSAYNYRYDYNGGHMRPLGFYDYFYLAEDFKPEMFTNDTVISNGIRVDFVIGRYGLKKLALMIYGKDTSNCYHYDSFYVVPVIIDFQLYDDNHPFFCGRNFHEFISRQGKKIRFEYKHEAAIVIKVTELPIPSK